MIIVPSLSPLEMIDHTSAFLCLFIKLIVPGSKSVTAEKVCFPPRMTLT